MPEQMELYEAYDIEHGLRLDLGGSFSGGGVSGGCLGGGGGPAGELGLGRKTGGERIRVICR